LVQAAVAWENFAANEYWHLYYGEDDFIGDLDCEPLSELSCHNMCCKALTLLVKIDRANQEIKVLCWQTCPRECREL
jgi:hypothetical protein